ncbi:MAG: DoxX family protein, partial [[Mycobacterium] stephanolepidis]
YLGGAVTIDMHEEVWFAVVFAVGFGLLIWAAMILRRRELLRVLIGADH